MKLLCEECDWTGTDKEMLRAPNPFDIEDRIVGCPKCKSVEHLTEVCDEPNCRERSSCGTPIPGGYRRTCYTHMPKA